LIQPTGATGEDLSQTAIATFQHALLRGLESAFQLEEGEILAEPMPTRDPRKGFLLYEATEGGAGVLTRLVAEPKTLSTVAIVALRIMHFDVTDEASLPADQSGLTDVQDTPCVAACYRCLMSYYNQPEHELIDRRDEAARALLLRLARATTSMLETPATRPGSRAGDVPAHVDPALAHWLEVARARELPPPDAAPFVDGDAQLPLVWRAHYVAAAFEGTPGSVVKTLEDKGFEVVAFPAEDSNWPPAFSRLATALGRG
jgi:hypothetical protein